MHDKQHRIPPHQLDRSKELRREATFPERLLWGRLRSAKLGCKFRQQHVIGPFYADFYCASAKLVIELDGITHDDRLDYDQKRTLYLEQRGLKVIRFTNDEVLDDLDAVVKEIEQQLSERAKFTPSPTPPSEGGE